MNIIKKPTDRDLLIYCVDDEEYYLNLIKVNLNKLGYNNLKTFSNGEDCLLEMIKEKPDCVVLDYILKDGMNADEILKKIKINFSSVDVIILSGQEDVNIATSIIRQGATDYVVKNKMSFFNLGNILSKIKNIINSNELGKWKTRRIKTLYTILIVIVWIIGGIGVYIKVKNGIIF
jgi:DNA-binding NtrC family response regulator